MSGSSRAIEIDRVGMRAVTRCNDEVAVEEPLEIQVCAKRESGAAARSVSITMRTPGDDAELAIGFLFGESVISGIDDVACASAVGEPDPDSGRQNTIRVELNAGVDVDFERLQRHFYTTSSCGVCGRASLEAVRLATGPLVDRDFRIAREKLVALPARLRESQRVFAATGGLHAAAVFGPDGGLGIVREDVGRHNAVDKVVGALLYANSIPAGRCGLVVSGRASFELVQKAVAAGMPMLAAVGAPSSLAVRLAREFGLTLVGFLRGDTFNVYTGGHRLEL